MCFRDRFGYRLITMRRYYGLSGRRTFNISKNSKIDRTLVFELVSESGSIGITLINKVTNEETNRANMKTGIYGFKIKMGESYQLIITSSKAVGSYKLRIGNV